MLSLCGKLKMMVGRIFFFKRPRLHLFFLMIKLTWDVFYEGFISEKLIVLQKKKFKGTILGLLLQNFRTFTSRCAHLSALHSGFILN